MYQVVHFAPWTQAITKQLLNHNNWFDELMMQHFSIDCVTVQMIVGVFGRYSVKSSLVPQHTNVQLFPVFTHILLPYAGNLNDSLPYQL